MNTNTLVITVEHIRTGAQPRAYADHEYSARITFEAKRRWNMPLPERVEKIARAIVHDWTHVYPQRPGFTEFGCYLRTLEKIAAVGPTEGIAGDFSETWEVVVNEPFYD